MFAVNTSGTSISSIYISIDISSNISTISSISCSIKRLLTVEFAVQVIDHQLSIITISGLKWMDGSITQDIPIKELARLFNVKQFIVSQVMGIVIQINMDIL